MLYFSYGSNMSIRRLRARVPSATFVAVATLATHKLEFHKAGNDGSGKCDATATGSAHDTVIGVVFDISRSEKPLLDRKEGLGYGYEEKIVALTSTEGTTMEAATYYATHIDSTLKPYHWYKKHVMTGARENGLPEPYIRTISSIDSIADPKLKRHKAELAIYR